MRKKIDERGQAVVETMLVIPLILIFLLALCDIGRYALVWTSVEQASTAVSEQYVDMETLSRYPTQVQATIRSAALAAAPNLDSSKLTVTPKTTTTQLDNYTHHLPNLNDPDRFVNSTKTVASAAVTYTITYTDAWMTTIGVAANAVQGVAGNKFTITITKTRNYDASKLNGVW